MSLSNSGRPGGGGGKERGTTDRGAGRVKLGRGGWGHKAGKGGEGEGWLEGYGINCHSDSEISQVGKVSAVCECVSVGVWEQQAGQLMGPGRGRMINRCAGSGGDGDD